MNWASVKIRKHFSKKKFQGKFYLPVSFIFLLIQRSRRWHVNFSKNVYNLIKKMLDVGTPNLGHQIIRIIYLLNYLLWKRIKYIFKRYILTEVIMDFLVMLNKSSYLTLWESHGFSIHWKLLPGRTWPIFAFIFLKIEICYPDLAKLLHISLKWYTLVF